MPTTGAPGEFDPVERIFPAVGSVDGTDALCAVGANSFALPVIFRVEYPKDTSEFEPTIAISKKVRQTN